MTTTTYSSKANAARAARKDLGGEAIPGTDFHLVDAGAGRWGWGFGNDAVAADHVVQVEALKVRASGRSYPETPAVVLGDALGAVLDDEAAAPGPALVLGVADLSGCKLVEVFEAAVDLAAAARMTDSKLHALNADVVRWGEANRPDKLEASQRAFVERYNVLAGRAKAKPAAQARPRAAAKAPRVPTTAKPRKSATAALEAAQKGVQPEPPVFASASAKPYQRRLDPIVAAAAAGDVATLRAQPVAADCKDGRVAAMARYRDLCVVAIEARA